MRADEIFDLYGYKGSGSAAIEMALRAANLEYRVIEVASWDADTPVERLGELNPLKQIPTLVSPDGFVLTESAAILIYLGLGWPSPELLPGDERLRARAIQGMTYIVANCYSAVGIIDFPWRWTTSDSEAEQERIRAGTKARLLSNWEIFADMFPRECFLINGKPGALDYLTATVTRMFSIRSALCESRPTFVDTLELIEHDRCVAEVVEEHWPAREGR